jgi:transcriptional regulator with XRE-family HTH domain
MGFEYNKLRGRIVEKYGTQAKFAQELGISPTAMSEKMTGKTMFSQKDIDQWRKLLDIDSDDIGNYFFA